MLGKVYLVGAGPSDVGLFTRRGTELLQDADVVVYDALVGREVMGLIPADTRRINVGKHAGNHTVPQDEINRILLREAQAGRTVVRLKGGDPFLFGRGGEELELLTENDIPFEIVPGVTSAIAVPAYAGIPVTHRDCCSSVHIITGHTKKSAGAQIDFEALVRLDGTLVFLMGIAALEDICVQLVEAGMDPAMPAAVLERGTTASQRRFSGTVTSLPDIAARAQIKTPAIIVVGKVCALAERFSWAEKRPLGGKRIVVTRPKELASKLTGLLRHCGAEVIELPSIETCPIDPNERLDEALTGISRYGWLVFTSPSGVRLFFERMRKKKEDIRMLGGLKLAAIGSATACALEERGLIPTFVPQEYHAAALGGGLAEAVRDERVLIVRAKEGSPDLTAALDTGGIAYDDVALYETCYAVQDAREIIELIDSGEIDYVAFTSASTVRGFVKTLGQRDYSKMMAVCIGRSTQEQALQYGMRTCVSKEATIGSMVELMIGFKGAEWNESSY